MKRGTLFVLAIGLAIRARGFCAQAAHIEDVTALSNDHPAISYSQKPQDDPIARLQNSLDRGELKLDYSDRWNWYPALLKYFGINTDSQIMVFSKTSFQASKISPRAPRAIYFNDELMIGFVQGGEVVEVAAFDPKLGFNFYTLDVQKAAKPEFIRRDSCLQCHQGLGTLGVPGILVTSVFPGADGMPAFRGANLITDHRSHMDQRWGGWYVTGTHGSQYHLGNAVGHDPAHPQLLDTQGTQNLTTLARKFDTSRYLAPTSDIVALMILEHQTRMSNLITRIGWDARIAEADGKTDEAARDRLHSEIEEMVQYMVFADERLLEEPIAGVSTFTNSFPQRGPRDHQGRSLRDFDLEQRLFKYPLSYMIYSAAFDALPGQVREQVYRRLYEVLSSKDETPIYAKLAPDAKRAALEILRDTKAGLPAY